MTYSKISAHFEIHHNTAADLVKKMESLGKVKVEKIGTASVVNLKEK